MTSTNPKTYEPATSRKVAFLGLGVMGFPMAGHLALAGHQVTVYNRSAPKREAWVKEFGGKAAATPHAAVQDCDFVFCCVGNDDDLRSVVLGETGAFAGMKPGAVLVDHTTASADAWLVLRRRRPARPASSMRRCPAARPAQNGSWRHVRRRTGRLRRRPVIAQAFSRPSPASARRRQLAKMANWVASPAWCRD
jgi:hypothetical protein